VTRRPRAVLSGRELEVVLLLADGYVPKEIAGRLGISRWTVHSHIAAARRRTESQTTAQLLARFRRRRPRSIDRAFA
jgi:DNA-binding CsgD family transcriptional regulator